MQKLITDASIVRIKSKLQFMINIHALYMLRSPGMGEIVLVKWSGTIRSIMI
jgi:hypothetical protein